MSIITNSAGNGRIMYKIFLCTGDDQHARQTATAHNWCRAGTALVWVQADWNACIWVLNAPAIDTLEHCRRPREGVLPRYALKSSANGQGACPRISASYKEWMLPSARGGISRA